MIDLARDIHSLTDFKRHTTEHLARLKETGRPEVLTVNGKAEVVVQDAKAYQALLAELDRLDALEKIGQAIGRLRQGEKGIPLDEAFVGMFDLAGKDRDE